MPDIGMGFWMDMGIDMGRGDRNWTDDSPIHCGWTSYRKQWTKYLVALLVGAGFEFRSIARCRRRTIPSVRIILMMVHGGMQEVNEIDEVFQKINSKTHYSLTVVIKRFFFYFNSSSSFVNSGNISNSYNIITYPGIYLP